MQAVVKLGVAFRNRTRIVSFAAKHHTIRPMRQCSCKTNPKIGIGSLAQSTPLTLITFAIAKAAQVFRLT